MTIIITIVLAAWITSAIIRSADSKRKAKQIANISTRQSKAESEWKRVIEEEKANTARIVELEKQNYERMKWEWKQEELNRKFETQIAKHEEQLRKHEFLLQQMVSDIDNLAWRIEEAQKYSVYLESERDKCIPGGKEYFKWQNKLSTNDDKIYRLTKQMNKAQFAKAEAERKLKEVA